MENPEKILVYTDGGALNNPGPAAAAFILKKVEGSQEIPWKEYSEFLGKATNNEAEFWAVILALKKLKHLLGKKRIKRVPVEFFSDSQLLINQLNHRFKIEAPKIQKLFLQVWNILVDYDKVKFSYIPREKNKAADQLVQQALKQKISQ